MTKGQVPAAITKEGLIAKSRIYIQRAFRAKLADDLDEYQLWASLALELLGKAALAGIHPSLVVDPNHYESLFAEMQNCTRGKFHSTECCWKPGKVDIGKPLISSSPC